MNVRSNFLSGLFVEMDHVYCINLERSPERRLQAQAEFDEAGLEVEFFRATDGKVEAPEGLFITKSEWGCADSHIRIWRDMIENGYETALVFEDDIKLDPNFSEKLQDVLAELPPDWDYVNLGATDEVRINYKRFSDHLMVGQSLNAHAYLISAKCANKWSDFDPKFFKCQFDVFISNYPSNNFHVEKALAVQRGESTIGGGMNRTHDWTFFIHKWGIVILFIIFLFLVRNIIIREMLA